MPHLITKQMVAKDFLCILARYISQIERLVTTGGVEPKIIALNLKDGATDKQSLALSIDDYSKKYIRPLASEMACSIEEFKNFSAPVCFSNLPIPSEGSHYRCEGLGISVLFEEAFHADSNKYVWTLKIGVKQMK